MATLVIDRNEARVPFFGDKMSFITGLDPLGIQNPSTQTYSYLMPGLNNVTNHIRNYSFYCWLLDAYAEQIKSADPLQQNKFIRKAEYILALIAVKMEIPGVSGKNYAGNEFSKGIQEFDLNKGTYNEDGSTYKTYWQYGSGVFGQYYVGSLHQIGLIEEPINDLGEHLGIYRRTPVQDHLKVSGEQLAAAFDENIQKENKELFFRCIQHAKVNQSELVQLSSDFNVTSIAEKTNEAKFLIELLLDIDEPLLQKEEPLNMRNQTMLHLLRFAEKREIPLNDRDFTMYAYDVKGIYNGEADDSLTGWYFYQFNEYWQVACTAIFNGMIDFLEEQKGPGWMHLNNLVSESTHAIVNFLSESDLSKGSETTGTIGIPDAEKELYEKLMNGRKVNRMAYGFLLIWKLYDENKEQLLRFKEYTNKRDIGVSGDGLSYYLNYNKQLDQTLAAFIEEFLKSKIIYRHQYVAYRKIGRGFQSTQKYIIEDNYIRKIGNFSPFFTSPRVGNAIAYLKDLHLLNNTKLISESGIELLKYYDQ